jgi:hypothetical protein
MVGDSENAARLEHYSREVAVTSTFMGDLYSLMYRAGLGSISRRCRRQAARDRRFLACFRPDRRERFAIIDSRPSSANCIRDGFRPTDRLLADEKTAPNVNPAAQLIDGR